MSSASNSGPGASPGDLSIAINDPTIGQVMTARIAGQLRDLELDVSPKSAGVDQACRHMAKALNLALQGDFLETKLEPVYEVARVRKGTVRILHREFIGLGDGILASVGKAAKSFTLTLKGPDPASAKAARARASGESSGLSPATGILNLLARKLNLVQEYEDMVPAFVEQTLDRLEAVQMIEGWKRSEWNIETTVVGLDVILTPVPDGKAKKRRERRTK